MKLNYKDFINFLNHFGLDFYYIIKWVQSKDNNLADFIIYQKMQRKNLIQQTFTERKKLFNQIMNEVNIDKWNIDENDKDFLKSNNLIVEDDLSRLNYFDNLSKIVFDEMRKEK